MLIKEVITERDKLKNYLHSLSVALNYCKLQIGDRRMIGDLEGLYAELEEDFKRVDESLKPFENMSM